MRATSLLIASLLAACQTTPPAPTPQEPPPVEEAEDEQDGRSLILVSLDGFRWDYLDRAETPNLDRIATGVRAESFQPPFPSYTFPSHYTIVTGLHPENHGIISNVFYDPERREQFKLGAPEDMTDGRWWGGEPLWNTAERQGVMAATLFWPGSEARIGGMRPTHWTAYDSGMRHSERVDRVLGWLGAPAAERPGFITLYFSSVDSAGHGHGPDATEVVEAVQGVDSALGQLMEGIEAAGLTDQVDIVVVSDHGMAPKDPEKIVFLDEAGISLGQMNVVEYSPLFQAQLGTAYEPAEVRDAIGALDHVECHVKGEIPEGWHYRAHRAIGDVVCLAENGWQLTQRAYYEKNPDRFTGGTHGWDPAWREMHGILLAHGPRFQEGKRLGTVDAVDLYGVLCAALEIEPAENDGDPALIKEMLR